MKKKLLLLLIPLLIISTTACGKKESVKKEDNKKTIILKDDKTGYKTTFKYDNNENYSDVIKNNSGASAEIEFENEDKDVSFQMYYNTIGTASYENSQKNRSGQKYYKEVKIGKYEGYTYGEYDNGLYLIIKLDVDKEKDTVALLFVSIDRIDNNKDIIVSDIFNKELKDFFETIEFEKIKQ